MVWSAPLRPAPGAFAALRVTSDGQTQEPPPQWRQAALGGISPLSGRPSQPPPAGPPHSALSRRPTGALGLFRAPGTLHGIIGGDVLMSQGAGSTGLLQQPTPPRRTPLAPWLRQSKEHGGSSRHNLSPAALEAPREVAPFPHSPTRMQQLSPVQCMRRLGSTSRGGGLWREKGWGASEWSFTGQLHPAPAPQPIPPPLPCPVAPQSSSPSPRWLTGSGGGCWLCGAQDVPLYCSRSCSHGCSAP